MRFIFREFPFDPVAAGAFMLARCAPADKYFSIIELLFEQQQQWAVEKPLGPLLAIAKQAGFTEDSFKTCLANQKVLDGIEWVRNRAADKFKVEFHPDLLHQWPEGIGGHVDRGNGQGHPALSQELTTVFPGSGAPGAPLGTASGPYHRPTRSGKPATPVAQSGSAIYCPARCG